MWYELLYSNTLAGTLAELREEIGVAKKALTGMKQSVVSISSGCDLFVRFITLTSLDQTVSITFLSNKVVLLQMYYTLIHFIGF